MDKDALRRHRAFEKQFDKARQAALTSGRGVSASEAVETPLASSSDGIPQPATALAGATSVSRSMPDVSQVSLDPLQIPRRSLPEATFTPTAAGLRAPESQPPAASLDLQSILSTALSTILASSLHQTTQSQPQVPVPEVVPSRTTDRPRSPYRDDSDSSVDSDRGEADPEDLEFSEDEGLVPDAPVFSGLFRPALFRSLLHKWPAGH